MLKMLRCCASLVQLREVNRMNTYENYQDIQNLIMKIENYPHNSFMYANLCGKLYNYISDKDMNAIRVGLDYELEMKEISDELKYELEAGK